MLSKDQWEFLPLEKSNPNLLAYSKHPKADNINLDLFLFSCENCFVCVSLSNHVDILYSKTPTYLSHLHPISIKSPYYGPEQVEYVPMDLAQKVIRNSSLVYPSFENLTLCLSKKYHVSDFTCSHIELTKFAAYAKPWNHQQYLYVLPFDETVNLNTLWIHNPKYAEAQVLQSVLGIVISNLEQSNVVWQLGRRYLSLEAISLGIGENTIQFNIIFEKADVGNPSLDSLQLSISGSIVQDIITVNIQLNCISRCLAITKIYKLIDDQLVLIRNISSFGNYWFFLNTFNNCTDTLPLSHLSYHDSIHTYLLCLKRKVILQNIFGKNFQLELLRRENFRIRFKDFVGYDIDSLWFGVSHSPTQIRYIACGNRFDETSSNYHLF